MSGEGVDVQVSVDCADPAALGRFWAAVLGYEEEPPPEGFADWPTFLTSIGYDGDFDDAYAIVDPAGRRPRMFFHRVPEGKVAKNRVHLDVNVGGPRGTPPEERWVRVLAKAAELVAAGATEVGRFEELGERWIVMADPEGNEFCLQ